MILTVFLYNPFTTPEEEALRELQGMVPVYVDELGFDSNGYEIRAKTIYKDKVASYVIIDEDYRDEGLITAAIIYHEMYHVRHTYSSESSADAYAYQRTGINLYDAYA